MNSWTLAARAAASSSGARGVGLAQADVVLDGAVEEVGVLVHHRDAAADLVEGQRAEIVAAERARAALRVVEAQQQAHDRRLARAARSDDAHALARRAPSKVSPSCAVRRVPG